MSNTDLTDRKPHKHRGKFTQGLLDNDQIVKALNIQPGQSILDAGCGNGYMSKLFSKAVTESGKVYALDPDGYFIKILRDETKGTNIQTQEKDITRPTTLDESSIDLIYICAVVHGFSNEQMEGFLHEVRRLLKPGALLAIVEIEKKETPFGPPLELRYSPEDLRKRVPLSPVRTIQAGEFFYMQIFQNK